MDGRRINHNLLDQHRRRDHHRQSVSREMMRRSFEAYSLAATYGVGGRYCFVSWFLTTFEEFYWHWSLGRHNEHLDRWLSIVLRKLLKIASSSGVVSSCKSRHFEGVGGFCVSRTSSHLRKVVRFYCPLP